MATDMTFAGHPLNRVRKPLNISGTQIFHQLRRKKKGNDLFGSPRTGQKTTPGYPDAENVIAISADKGYKTMRKPNQSPPVMNNIIFKSSVCPYVIEGCIGLLKLPNLPNMNRKRGFRRLRVMRWFLSNDPNNLCSKGLTIFLLYLG